MIVAISIFPERDGTLLTGADRPGAQAEARGIPMMKEAYGRVLNM